MIVFVVAFCALSVGVWAGSEYTRWLMRREMRSLSWRVSQYTDSGRPADLRKPW